MMSDRSRTGSAQVVVPCTDLAATLAFLTERLGFRVESVLPADAPMRVVVSGHGITLSLENASAPLAPITLRLPVDRDASASDLPCELRGPGGFQVVLEDADPPLVVPPLTPAFLVTRAGGDWAEGRAGMQYRDLIPGRLGRRFVASHIRIPGGGVVPDYVHWHRVRFQVIYCRRGWVRVVYEDQGPPLVLHEGDCVLQPPRIRHRVLEASPGLEVVELGSPAEHETRADHALALPTANRHPERDFAGQRFVHHVANRADWQPTPDEGVEARDTGIAAATGGLASVRVLRSRRGRVALRAARELQFLFVLDGSLQVTSGAHGRHELGRDDACVLPPEAKATLATDGAAQWLEIRVPASSIAEAGAGSTSSIS